MDVQGTPGVRGLSLSWEVTALGEVPRVAWRLLSRGAERTSQREKGQVGLQLRCAPGTRDCQVGGVVKASEEPRRAQDVI